MELKQVFTLFLTFLTLGFSDSFSQTTYYADQAIGSNSNNGLSPTTAFATVEYAVANALLPGDTLLLMGEFANPSFDPNYQFSGNINDPHIWNQENSVRVNNLHGTPSAWITFKPYNANTRLRGDGANILRITNASYLRFEGLEVEGMVDSIPLQTALALQFLYRVGTDTVTQYRVPPGTPDSVVGTLTLPALGSNIPRPSYTDTRGIYASNVHHLALVGNHVHHTPGNGLRVAICDYVWIEGNEVDNTSRKSYSGTHGLVVASAASIDSVEDPKIFIQRNLVHHNYNEVYSWAPTKTFITPRIDEGKGISLQRNDSLSGWLHGRFLVENNICYWNGYSGVHANDGLRMDFVHNTSYMNCYTNVVTYANGVQSGNQIGISAQDCNDIRIVHNVVQTDASWNGFAISVSAMPNLVVSDNLLFGVNGTLAQDADVVAVEVNTQIADPQWIDPANFDFHLQAGSPAVNAGNGGFAPLVDYYGTFRDSLVDLGAVEFEFPMVSNMSGEIKPAFRVYPNPFSGGCLVEGEWISDSMPRIWNTMGQSMSGIKLEKRESGWFIDGQALSEGVYWLELDGEWVLLIKQ